VRRAIGPLWPILSAAFGIHPWHVDRLTPDELAAYVEQAQLRLTATHAPTAAKPAAGPPGVVSIPI
jgi:hypothetical protein